MMMSLFARIAWVARLALIFCALAQTGCGMLTNAAAELAETEPREAPTDTAGEQQILVMLTEVHRPHFRASGNYGDVYDDPTEEPAALRDRIAALNKDHGLRKLAQWPMPDLRIRCYLEAVQAGRDVAEILARLHQDQRVESAQLLQTFRTLAHDDTYYSLQSNAKTLKLDELHRLATGRGVRVALIDTAVEASHPDLQGQLVVQQDFTDQPMPAAEIHGTEVAGLMAAAADNHVGIVGVAPQARLMSLRACWQVSAGRAEARCTSFSLAKALQYAMGHGARILNMSLSGPSDPLVERLLREAQRRNIFVVAAVDGADPINSFPASLPGVMAVTCCVKALSPDIVHIPSTRVLTTTPQASWGFVTGSSFAAAQFSGLAALALELAPALSADQLTALLGRHHLPTPEADAVSIDTLALLHGLASGATAAAMLPADPVEPRQP